MQQPSGYKRQAQRVTLNLPIEISFGTQITLKGDLKDISLKSAFIAIKSSIYMQINDELSFAIRPLSDNAEDCVTGMARISRVSVGEGIAIYFTRMDENSSNRLKILVDVR